jgi:DNA-directed RNA polymerase specialized sigma24 family protein
MASEMWFHEKAAGECVVADDASITYWIGQLKEGDHGAAQPLWDRYFDKLVRLAYQRLHGSARAAADEEDVALSAFHSFCRAAEKGRFPQLNDRDDLWKVLVVLTERKALNQMRDQRRLKRGGDGKAESSALSDLPGPEPTPEFAAIVVEECQRRLDQLGDENLRRIALAKMEGLSNAEIAAHHDVALRTVERKLGLIRRIWESPD